jgi:hypothetical protein
MSSHSSVFLCAHVVFEQIAFQISGEVKNMILKGGSLGLAGQAFFLYTSYLWLSLYRFIIN